jgi:hypothetical protein
MNRQVHSKTGKSPYEIVFNQLMPDRPRISTSQRSTAAAIDQLNDFQGLVITQPDTPVAEIPDQEIAQCSFRRKPRKWRFRFEERRERVAAAR